MNETGYSYMSHKVNVAENLDHCESLLCHSLCPATSCPEVMIEERLTDLTLGIPLPRLTNWTPSKVTHLSNTGFNPPVNSGI